MEGDQQEGDVAREEARVTDELSQTDKPKAEEPREERATEEAVELPGWRLRQPVQEPVAAAPGGAGGPDGNEEDVVERVVAPPPVPESLPARAEEPEVLSDLRQAEAEPIALEAEQSADAGIETQRIEEAPRPPKKKRARRKKATHKRTDRGRKRPARKRVKKISAKRSAKRRKKSRA